MLKLKGLLLASLLALIALGGTNAPARAQGCGPQNPNCIVTTMPLNDASRRAASDQFVQNALAGFVPSLPCAVCAVTNASNTFLGPQTSQGATTTQPGWYAQLTGDTFARMRVGLNGGDVPSIAFGPGNVARDTFIERIGAASLRFGTSDAASPVAQTLGVQNVLAGTSNTAGANWTFNGSRGTGTGIGGSILFQVAPAGSSGSTQNPLVNAGLITGGGQWDIGNTLTAFQTSDVAVINNNASAAPAVVNGFSPIFRIIGKDGDRPPMSIQGFGSTAEPTILLMHARGTGAAPTASQSGDFVGELFAHPCGNGTTPCTYMHDVGAGVIWRMLENATTTAGEAIDIWATPIGGTTVALAATFGGNGTLSTTNSITVGTVSPASGTVRGVTINGAAAGSNAGSNVVGNDGGSVAWAIGSYTAILGGTYTNQTLIYSASGNYVLRPAASVTPANNGDLMIQGTSNTSLTFKFKGSDGTVRSASLTLS